MLSWTTAWQHSMSFDWRMGCKQRNLLAVGQIMYASKERPARPSCRNMGRWTLTHRCNCGALRGKPGFGPTTVTRGGVNPPVEALVSGCPHRKLLRQRPCRVQSEGSMSMP